MKTKILCINVARYFKNTTPQEAIKRRFQEMFVLFKMKIQSITRARIK